MATYDFGPVDALDAEAIGVPGKRTFRIRAWKDQATASLWLEKQQLLALSLALRQVMAQVGQNPQPGPALTRPFPDHPTVDMKLGRLALGRDEDSDHLILWAHEAGIGEEAPPNFSCHFNWEQALAFCERAEAVCTAGRPICPLCSEPIDPEGHACVRSNGHSQQEIPPLEPGESP
ncbi:MAG: DUF3090 domain-containing protein [Dehalococcoidia bacterium]|nr:DUF3090 domain-containing protein [Dehalococcoidia bacterium]